MTNPSTLARAPDRTLAFTGVNEAARLAQVRSTRGVLPVEQPPSVAPSRWSGGRNRALWGTLVILTVGAVTGGIVYGVTSSSESVSPPTNSSRRLGDVCTGLACPCTRIDPGETNQTACFAYEQLPTSDPSAQCRGKTPIVPRIIHSIGREPYAGERNLQNIAAANPEYRINRHTDVSGAEYIREHCGAEAYAAYNCLLPGAYRADLFRYCAVYAEGGVYIDEDLIPLKPLDQLYSPCAEASLGHDWPQTKSGAQKQIKLLSAKPHTSLFKCALDTVKHNIKNRMYSHILNITGPFVMTDCYDKHGADTSITYTDTRNAHWPYTGLRRGIDLLAYERPGIKAFQKDATAYDIMFKEKRVYASTCRV